MRDPKERLRDILDAIANIERYAARGRQAFENDELIQNWFVRHLQIIGEAAYALPADLRDQQPDIPWTEIIGMRHILVHDYFVIDTDIVWDAVPTPPTITNTLRSVPPTTHVSRLTASFYPLSFFLTPASRLTPSFCPYS